MDEIGKIIELKDDIAVIEITPSSGCSRCAQVNICNPFGKNKKVIELPNVINGQINDWVKIEIKEKNRVLSILLVFGLPILLFLIGVFIGTKTAGDNAGAILGGIGLILAFVIIKIINNYLNRKNKNLACIKEKIDPNKI